MSISRVSASAIAVFLGIALAAADAEPASRPASGPAVQTYDYWYNCLLGAQKIGWMHSTRTVAGGRITTAEASSFSIRRGAVAITITSSSQTVEDADGKPVSFVVESNILGTTSGQVADGKLRVKTTSAAGVQEQVVPLDAEALWPTSLDAAQQRVGFAEGATGSAKVYMPELNPMRPVTLQWRIGRTEARTVGGRDLRVTPVVASVAELPGMQMNSLVDPDQELVQVDADFGGLTIRMVRSTQEEAKTAGSAELFFSTLVRIARPLPPRWKIAKAVYLLSSRDGKELQALPDGAGQSVRRLADDRLQVTVERGPATAPAAQKIPYAGEADMKSFLAAGSLIDCGNEKIVAAAKKAIGGETDAFAAACRLEQFVNRHIRSKNLSRGMDAASVVLARAEGDCTEHAVLLAALCRAAGIPARCATGLVYFDSVEAGGPVFGYHMWTEVWIGGRWVGLDGTLAAGRVSATHIRLAASALSDADGVLGWAAGMTVVGNLKIEVKQVSLDEE